MTFSENSMCAILLCSYIGIQDTDTLKPLSLGEWNTFLEKLIAAKEEPKIIFQSNTDWQQKIKCSAAFAQRVDKLSAR